jgi:Terminase large subunit, T4likevirus-type, N-terminal
VIATDLALALDPVVLAERVGMTPDGWQADVLRSAEPRVILNCSRQSGKSTTTATLAVHTAVYQPASLVLLLAPALRQSGELFKKCAAVYRALDKPVPAESETALTVTLENGSRIVSLPGKDGTIRGFSGARLIVVDEASRVADETYYAVRPMLAVSGGRLVLMSTPFGTRGFFYEVWAAGGAGWKRIEVPATACPRISPAFLEEEQRSMGAWWYEQEYLCVFKDAEDAVFRRADIDAAFVDDVAPLFAAPGGTEPWPSTRTP